MAQIPLSDNTLIMPIQIGMIVSLGKVFNQTITDSAAKAILASMVASFIGRSISQVAFGWVPGAGNAINSSTAVSLTEAIGWKEAVDFYKKQKEDLSVG